MLQDFKKFILRGNVVDLAVAVVVGAAFSSIVTGLVNDMVTPFIAAVGGKHDFSKLAFQLHGSYFHYGDFINRIVAFVTIATVVFFFVVQPINKLVAFLKPSDDVEKPAERECPFCKSAIPSGASRCKFCTSKITPVSKQK